VFGDFDYYVWTWEPCFVNLTVLYLDFRSCVW
jgi:hypothetical protein